MNRATSLLLKDILGRARWALLGMGLLQFAFALTFIGISIPYSRYLNLPLMFMGLIPVLGPNRRMVQCLPIASGVVDRMQWLYSGGVVAILATVVSLLAWLCAVVFQLESQQVGNFKPVVLILGTPAAIGLLMILRRWTTSGLDPNNQNRPLLLVNFFWAPVLMVASELLDLSEFGPVTAITIGVLAIGFAAFFGSLLSPAHYRAWIAKSPRPTDYKLIKRRLISPAIEQIAWVSLFGIVFAVLFAWLSPQTSSRVEFATYIAFMPMYFGISILPALKVLRSLPHSLNHSTMRLMLIFLVPSLLTLTAYMGAFRVLGYDGTLHTLWITLPAIAVIAPFAPISMHLAAKAKAGRILFYLAFALLAAWAGKHIGSLASQYMLVGNCVAVAIVVATFFWIRHELRVGTMLYRFRTASYSLTG